MATWKTLTESDAGYVEVLTTSNNGGVFGYRLKGASAGPQVVAAGVCPSAEQVFERLLRIPTLPWMRGALVLIRLDALDDMLGDLNGLAPLGPIDRTIILPWSSANRPSEAEVRRNYHLVLRACADLGMISGRGVSRRSEQADVSHA